MNKNQIKFQNALSIQKNIDEKLPEFDHLHLNLYEKYMNETQIQSKIQDAFRELFIQDCLPQNPYPFLYRCISKNIIFFDMKEEKLQLYDPIDLNDGYGIQKVAQISDILDEEKNFYGISPVLQWVDYNQIFQIYQMMSDYIYEYSHDFKNCQIQVSISIGGSLLFVSDQIKHEYACNNNLELSSEIFIQTSSEEDAIQNFLNIIYEDIMSLIKLQSKHIFKKFVIKKWDSQHFEKKTFDLAHIITQKISFLGELKIAIKDQHQFYLKVFLRVRKNNGNADFNKTGESFHSNLQNHKFIYTRKSYNLLFKKADQTMKIFEFQPLGSLLKVNFLFELQRVFLSLESCQRYSSFHFEKSQQYFQSKSCDQFLSTQTKLLSQKFQKQDLVQMCWLMFYIVNIDESSQDITDMIIMIINGDLSILKGIINQINHLQEIILYTIQNENSQLNVIVNEQFDQFKEQLKPLLARGSVSDFLIYRNFIFSLLTQIEDQSTSQLDYSKPLNKLFQLCNQILKSMLINNSQQVCQQVEGLTNYIQLKITEQKNLSSCYNQQQKFSKLNKISQSVLHVTQEVNNNLEKSDFKNLSTSEMEQTILIQYGNDYEIFETFYKFFNEIIFGAQVPNIFCKILSLMDRQTQLYNLQSLTDQELKKQQSLVTNQQLLEWKGKIYQNVYAYTDVFIKSQGNNEIISHQKILQITSSQQVILALKFLQNYQWKKSFNKIIPESFNIHDILSISSENFQPSFQIKNIAKWQFNWDFIVKGTNQELAEEFYVDILISYFQMMQQQYGIKVIGIFENDEVVISNSIINKDSDKRYLHDLLIASFHKGNEITFRFLTHLGNEIQMYYLHLNMHYLDVKYNIGEVISLKQFKTKQKLLNDYAKVFFNKEDFVKWNKIYEFDQNLVIKLINKQLKAETDLQKVFIINYQKMIKLNILKKSLQGDDILLLYRYHLSDADILYNMKDFCDAIIQNIQLFTENEEQLWVETNQQFILLVAKLKQKTFDYLNVTMEGLLVSAFNLTYEIDSNLEKKQFSQTVFNLTRLSQFLNYAANCISLGFMNFLQTKNIDIFLNH